MNSIFRLRAAKWVKKKKSRICKLAYKKLWKYLLTAFIPQLRWLINKYFVYCSLLHHALVGPKGQMVLPCSPGRPGHVLCTSSFTSSVVNGTRKKVFWLTDQSAISNWLCCLSSFKQCLLSAYKEEWNHSGSFNALIHYSWLPGASGINSRFICVAFKALPRLAPPTQAMPFSTTFSGVIECHSGSFLTLKQFEIHTNFVSIP